MQHISFRLISAQFKQMIIACLMLLLSPALAFANSPIGTINHSAGAVFIERSAQQIQGSQGAQVFQDDVIVTGPQGSVGVTFVDRTTFALGENARMILDEYAYDPVANNGQGVLGVVSGSFAFVSGGLGKVGNDALSIDTPTMSIGIRGTTVAGRSEPNGKTTAILLQDSVGTTGKIIVFNNAPKARLIMKANYGSLTQDRYTVPSEPRQFTPAEINAIAGDALNALADTMGNNAAAQAQSRAQTRAQSRPMQSTDQQQVAPTPTRPNHSERAVDESTQDATQDAVNESIADATNDAVRDAIENESQQGPPQPGLNF